MKKLHYSWVVWLGCALLTFCIGGLGITTFAVYQPYIRTLNGFTNAQSSSLITVRSLVIFFSMYLSGIYYKKFSLRTGMTFAALLMAAAFAILGFSRSYGGYCIGAGMIGLAYGLGSGIPIAILLEHWFVKKRTLALGLSTACSGLLALAFPSLLTALIETQGLGRTFLAEAALMAVLALLIRLLIRDRPAQKGLEPYGADDPETATKLARSGRQIRKKHWILLSPALLLTGVSAGVATGHLTMLTDSIGFDGQITALALTVVNLMTMVSGAVFGWLAERLSVYAVNRIYGLLLTLGMTLLCFTGGHALLLITAAVLYGAGAPIVSTGITAWAGDLSTPECYDRTVRRFFLLNSAGGLIFSSFPGILADRFGGSYVPAYLCFSVFVVFTVAAVQRVYAVTKKQS